MSCELDATLLVTVESLKLREPGARKLYATAVIDASV